MKITRSTSKTGRRSPRSKPIADGTAHTALHDGERLAAVVRTGVAHETLYVEHSAEETGELLSRIVRAVLDGRATWRIIEPLTKLFGSEEERERFLVAIDDGTRKTVPR